MGVRKKRAVQAKETVGVWGRGQEPHRRRRQFIISDPREHHRESEMIRPDKPKLRCSWFKK